MSSALRCETLDLAEGANAGGALLRPYPFINFLGRAGTARAGNQPEAEPPGGSCAIEFCGGLPASARPTLPLWSHRLMIMPQGPTHFLRVHPGHERWKDAHLSLPTRRASMASTGL